MRRQMGTPASGFATPTDQEDMYEDLHQRLSDEVARRQAADDARLDVQTSLGKPHSISNYIHHHRLQPRNVQDFNEQPRGHL